MKCGYGKEWKKISWVDKISNEEVLAKVEEDRQIMKIIQQRQHHWTWHFEASDVIAGYYRRTDEGKT